VTISTSVPRALKHLCAKHRTSAKAEVRETLHTPPQYFSNEAKCRNANTDSVLRSNFLGEGFAKTETNFFEIRREFVLVFARRQGLGGNARNSKIQMQKFIYCLCHFSAMYCPCLKGMHPRHPPRAFPLWLLAPRCLCAGKARASWGEEVSSPRVGTTFSDYRECSALAIPTLRFSILFLWCRFRF
jgi:hypothetical protein